MILVSACLLGHKTKYNGGDNAHDILMKYDKFGKFIAVCPESLGLLATPRLPSEIINGDGTGVLLGEAKVISKDNSEVTNNFIIGAEKVLTIANQYKIEYAILKERSPSCGLKQIYDGTFSGNQVIGSGVCTALLLQNKIKVFSDEEITEKLLQKMLKL